MRIPGLPLDSELAAELYVDEVLTGDGHLVTIDIPGSVSGLIRFDLESSQTVRALKEKLRLQGGPHGSSGS